MLTTTNPEIVKIYEQIDNCIELKGIVQNKIDQGHPIEYLDTFFQPCGTVGCVLGDWIIKNHSFEKVSEIEEIADELWFDGEIFGSLDTVSMFGSSLDGTYQQRLTRLEAHIQALHEKAASLVGVAA